MTKDEELEAKRRELGQGLSGTMEEYWGNAGVLLKT